MAQDEQLSALVVAIIVLFLLPAQIISANGVPPPDMIDFLFQYRSQAQSIEAIQLLHCDDAHCASPTLLAIYGDCTHPACLSLSDTVELGCKMTDGLINSCHYSGSLQQTKLLVQTLENVWESNVFDPKFRSEQMVFVQDEGIHVEEFELWRMRWEDVEEAAPNPLMLTFPPLQFLLALIVNLFVEGGVFALFLGILVFRFPKQRNHEERGNTSSPTSLSIGRIIGCAVFANIVSLPLVWITFPSLHIVISKSDRLEGAFWFGAALFVVSMILYMSRSVPIGRWQQIGFIALPLIGMAGFFLLPSVTINPMVLLWISEVVVILFETWLIVWVSRLHLSWYAVLSVCIVANLLSVLAVQEVWERILL